MAALTQKELIEINKNRDIYQICVLTNDVYRTMDEWIETFRIGPWTLMDFNDKTVKGLKVDGKLVDEPFQFLIAICTVGNTEFEIIEPVKGPMIYREYLDRRGEGLHHFKEKIADEDWDNTLKDYADRGYAITQTGGFHEDKHAYVDTEGHVGFVLELGNCPVLTFEEGEVTVYPSE